MVFVLDTNKRPLAPCHDGSFDIKGKDGKRIVQGISYKYIQVIQRFDGYTYRKEEAELA